MKYILLNRNNIVVDILDNYIRYIKLQTSNGLTIGCEKNEGTGVIGSDCNTHYTLIKADTQSNPDAVWILELGEIPDNVKPLYTKYDNETNSLVPRYTLQEMQQLKQEKNKSLFASYLATHPLVWIDGKTYGITEQDQSEISLNLNQYQIAVQAGIKTPTLEWHAKHEECEPWTVEKLTALSLAISEEVYPIYHLMQQYKTSIYNAKTIEEVEAIKLEYENEETAAAD